MAIKDWMGIGLSKKLHQASQENITGLHRLINAFGDTPSLNTELDGILIGFGITSNALERRSGQDRRQYPHPDPSLDRRARPPVLRNGAKDVGV